MASFRAKIKYYENGSERAVRKSIQVFEASLEEAKRALLSQYPTCSILDIVRENEFKQ